MDKELQNLKNLYLIYKKNIGRIINLKEKGLQPNEYNYYIINEVNLVKGIDKKFYLMVCYKSTGKTSDKIEIFDNKSKKVSFAEFCFFNDISLIDYVKTEYKFRNNGFATKAILKIEDISKKLKKCNQIKLICNLRKSKDCKNLNLKFYKDLGFEKINPKDSDLKNRIYMKKDLGNNK